MGSGVRPRQLFELDAPGIQTRMFSKADALPADVSRLPIKTIHLNKSPVVINNLNTLTPALAGRWGMDIEAGLQHAGRFALHRI